MPDGGGSPRRGRIWPAPVMLAAVAAVSSILYDASQRAVANVVIYPFAVALIFGPSLVYPWARMRDASSPKAVAACLFVPALWIAVECHRMSAVFSAGEAAFYAVNPIALGLLTAAALQMAVAEIVLTRVRSGRWRLRSGASFTVAAIAVSGAGFAVIARAHGASVVLQAYVAAYERLFGAS